MKSQRLTRKKLIQDRKAQRILVKELESSLAKLTTQRNQLNLDIDICEDRLLEEREKLKALERDN